MPKGRSGVKLSKGVRKSIRKQSDSKAARGRAYVVAAKRKEAAKLRVAESREKLKELNSVIAAKKRELVQVKLNWSRGLIHNSGPRNKIAAQLKKLEKEKIKITSSVKKK